jgi:hypothetical protein
MSERRFQFGCQFGFRSSLRSGIKSDWGWQGRILWVALAASVLGWPAARPAASRTSASSASSESERVLRARETPGARQNGTPTELPVALPKGKKLFLTDGTFQIVREYQREGDRVRYYSVERSAWEEIPASMVDWAATQKAEADDHARDKDLSQKIKASELAARTADIDSDRSYEARPGIILPDEAGLYALDGTLVVTMVQNLAVSRLDKGRTAERIITGLPIIPAKMHIAIPGKSAKLRLHGGDPEFYFRTADGREPAISLLRAEVKSDRRELETETRDLVGQVNYKGNEMPLLAWDAAQGLYRLTVEKEIEPGEYALIERTKEGIELYVWDFGVDAGGAAPRGGAQKKP